MTQSVAQDFIPLPTRQLAMAMILMAFTFPRIAPEVASRKLDYAGMATLKRLRAFALKSLR